MPPPPSNFLLFFMLIYFGKCRPLPHCGPSECVKGLVQSRDAIKPFLFGVSFRLVSLYIEAIFIGKLSLIPGLHHLICGQYNNSLYLCRVHGSSNSNRNGGEEFHKSVRALHLHHWSATSIWTIQSEFESLIIQLFYINLVLYEETHLSFLSPSLGRRVNMSFVIKKNSPVSSLADSFPKPWHHQFQ